MIKCFCLSLLLFSSFSAFAGEELTQEQAENNLKECGYSSSKEFITEKHTACVDVNAWDHCPDTGIRHFSGMCDTMSQDEFFEIYEEML